MARETGHVDAIGCASKGTDHCDKGCTRTTKNSVPLVRRSKPRRAPHGLERLGTRLPQAPRRFVLHITKQKEQFSIAYIHAIASVAGFAVTITIVDDDSIDITLKSKERGRPQLEIQLKACSTLEASGDSFASALPRKNYDDLRAEVLVPRYLVVLAIPAEIEKWLEHGDDQMLLRHTAYFLNLSGREATQNESTVTVYLPADNRLTVDSLKALMRAVLQDESA